ncbi:adenine deaminase [Mycoplasmatota bacterium]|nr:adenine deaminase [Mycoplasmatota bacterium]
MIKRMIDTAAMRRTADLVLKNANVVNVFSHEIQHGDLAIDNGKFIGVGNYKGNIEIDLKGKYVAPGLIDAHVHIESSSSTPIEFARAVLPRGTTTIVADPHEIANVLGLDGIHYMLKTSKDLPLKCYFMLPSCVPATSFESAGAFLDANELKKLIDHERILGLGELMNYPGVVSADEAIIEKIRMAKNAGKIIDGHGPVIKNEELNAYSIVGIRSDHECTSGSEMLNQIRTGMYIAIREGSACKDLVNLIGGVTPSNERRTMFCTDDRHPGDIVNYGHIDNNIRLAIKSGINPITAIRMGTLNAAECYNLKGIGAIAPGYKADFIIFDNLKDFNVLETYADGKKVYDDWYKGISVSKELNSIVTKSINLKEMKEKDLKIRLNSEKVNVIKVIPDSIVTEKVERIVDTQDGYFKYNPNIDIVQYYVIERHNSTGNIGKALIENFGLRNGAIASTISHDSHNLSVISDNTHDAFVAIKEIERIGGGIAIVQNGEVIGSVSLPIAGLMSNEKMEILSEKFKNLYFLTYKKLNINPRIKSLMTLSFMALPVIPEIKLTDLGLFDVLKFKHIGIEAE